MPHLYNGNLLTNRSTKNINRLYFIAIIGSMVLINLYILIDIIIMSYSLYTAPCQHRITPVKKQSLEQLSHSIEKMQETTDSLRNRMTTIRHHVAQNKNLISYLEELSNRIPADVRLSSIHVDKTRMTIQGEGKAQEACLEFFNNLKKSLFKEVIIQSLNYLEGAENLWGFTYQMALEK